MDMIRPTSYRERVRVTLTTSTTQVNTEDVPAGTPSVILRDVFLAITT